MSMKNGEIIRRIQKTGLRATPQRIQLLRLLSETKCHPSAEMLMKMAKKEGYSMSIGTVYNALESFEEKGLIRRVHDTNEIMRYDANTDFHIHIIDEDSHEIKDVFDGELERIIKKRLADKLPMGYNMDHLDISLYN
ncbi:MAG: Fur family transcriptional regulator [Eubacteriaceae bacterium]|nr:Fur family transcriptional regulator [Eubacteriaceae bacterium]